MTDAPSPPPRPRRVGWPSWLGLTAGVVLAIGLTLGFGLKAVLAAVGSVGLGGFVLICLVWTGVLVLLGSAWMLVAADAGPRGLAGFAWARTVREAAADVLPFSQVGGLVLGAEAAVAATGLAAAAVWAAMVVDLTTEMGAQLIYTLAGVAGLGWRFTRTGGEGGAAILWGGGALVVAGAALTAAFVALQRKGVAWAGRFASRWGR